MLGHKTPTATSGNLLTCTIIQDLKMSKIINSIVYTFISYKGEGRSFSKGEWPYLAQPSLSFVRHDNFYCDLPIQ